MMSLVFWIIIFIISLAVLIKSSDYFLESSQKVGFALKIPKFVIGATIIALGTSLPELISSIIAVMQSSSEIVIGNVVGSNISNIFLILGLATVIFGTSFIKREIFIIDVIIMNAVAILLAISTWNKSFPGIYTIIFLVCFLIYIIYILYFNKSSLPADEKDETTPVKIGFKTIIILLLSVLFLYLGAKYLVESVIKLSEIIKIGKEVIAVSAVAIGTSLPELIVSLISYKRGEFDISLGNIIGSNIFNVLGIVGISALFGKLIIPDDIVTFAIPVMIAAGLLFLFNVWDKKITRLEGALFLIVFIIFMAKMFKFF